MNDTGLVVGDAQSPSESTRGACCDLTERLNPIPASDKLASLLTPADGLCRLCHGSGHLLCYQDGKREFWTCPACNGFGARKRFAPTEYRTR